MEKIFLELFQVSAVCSMGILLVFAVSPLLSKKRTLFWRYVLWTAIAVRLVFPFDFSIPGKAVVFTLPENTQTEAEWDSSINLAGKWNDFTGDEQSSEEGKSSFARTQNAKEERIAPEAEEAGVESSNSKKLREEDLNPNSFPEMKSADYIEMLSVLLARYAWILWAAVAAALALWRMVCYGIFCRKADQTKVFLTIKENLSVYLSSAVLSPMLMGIRKPRILLPKKEYQKEELDFILEHESTHYHRKDLWVKCLFLAAKTIHWFNPFVALMERQAVKDMEFLCDDYVVKNFTKEEKKKYSETLLFYAAAKKRNGAAFCTSEFSRDVKTLKKRFANIFSEKSRKKGVLAAALGVGILVSVSFFVTFGMQDEHMEEKAVQNLEKDSFAGVKQREILEEKQKLLSGLSAKEAAKASYGAVFPKLIYASDERAVLYDYWGLLIYDMENQKIEQMLDLKAADLGYIQGEQATHIETSDDGTQILFYNEPNTKERFVYNIEDKKLEFSDLDSFAKNHYEGLFEREDRTYAQTKSGKLAYLSADSLQKEDGSSFHEEDLQGLSLILLDEEGGDARIYPLFAEVYEKNGESAESHLKWEDLRKVIGRKFLYEDGDGWMYYLEEDEKRESPLWEIAEAVHPILLTRYRQQERQVFGESDVPGNLVKLSGNFIDGRIVYQAAKGADVMSIKDPSLVSIALDGSDRKTADKIMYNTFDGLCEDGGWIYYSGWTNDGVAPRPLCRIAPDFSGEPEVVEEIPGLLCGVTDGFVYYLSGSGQASGIWKRNLSTGDEAIYDKWGISAEELFINVRELENLLEESEGEAVSGFRMLFRYDYDGEIRTYDVAVQL